MDSRWKMKAHWCETSWWQKIVLLSQNISKWKNKKKLSDVCCEHTKRLKLFVKILSRIDTKSFRLKRYALSNLQETLSISEKSQFWKISKNNVFIFILFYSFTNKKRWNSKAFFLSLRKKRKSDKQKNSLRRISSIWSKRQNFRKCESKLLFV